MPDSVFQHQLFPLPDSCFWFNPESYRNAQIRNACWFFPLYVLYRISFMKLFCLIPMVLEIEKNRNELLWLFLRMFNSKHVFGILLIQVMCCMSVSAQLPELKWKLNEEGSRFLKVTFLNQTWLRYNESNPGTLVMGEEKNHTFDIGLRRTRLQFFGQVSDRLFFYSQFGMNNFNYLSQNAGNRKLQAFFHDALGELKVVKNNNALKIGGGLTICSGLSRFTQPSIGTIATLDVPVFAQATVDQTDEFARKLSLYARGQIGRLDYRLVLSDPFPVSTSGSVPAGISSDASFALMGHRHQLQGFFMFNFFESESHDTPYMTGTYLGKKKILNLETGLIHQQNAMWSEKESDTLFHDLFLWSVAAFLDLPLHAEKGTAISAYLGYFNMDYGPNYIRNNGVMNTANGSNANVAFNGFGNSFPMFGTGHTLYAQTAFLLRKNLLGEWGTLMPYASMQCSDYKKLRDPMLVWDAGINWLISGHGQKISLGLQNRPVFDRVSLRESGRKSMLVLQYQISI